MEANEFTMICEVFGSPKRIRILSEIHKGLKTYKDFKKIPPRIPPSEFYKHLNILMGFGLIKRNENNRRKYEITWKGNDFFNIVKEMQNCLRSI